ncbi:hypothetical protein [Nocardia sp. NPDC004860]|uniref:hypothetical protein n=1 Tax=Nocardia sp. NPDC004860 TaxID=3154557 RepID=UPI0033BB3F9E
MTPVRPTFTVGTRLSADPINAAPQIARVLVNDPHIVLRHEPFGAPDQLTRERLQVEPLRPRRESGKTIVFVTHSVEEAVYLSARIPVMNARPGRIIVDRGVVLPGDDEAGVRAITVTATPEFQALEIELATAIQAVHV